MSGTILNLPVSIEGAFEMTRLPQEASTRLFYRIKRVAKPPVIFMQLTDDSHSLPDIIRTNEILTHCAIPTAKIHKYSIDEKWLLQSDLGDETLLQHLQENLPFESYQKAIGHILTLQQNTNLDTLPHYGEDDYIREAMLFCEYFLQPLKLSTHLMKQTEFAIFNLAKEMSTIPKSAVHKDFHSNNIMVCINELFVIDQQDMCQGPYTYDLASLLYDCYIDWPESVTEALIEHFHPAYATQPIPSNIGLSNKSSRITTTVPQMYWPVLSFSSTR